MHHVTRVHVVGADGDGDVGLGRNMLEKLFGSRVHAGHEGNGVLAVHVVHDVEVTHFITGGGPGGRRQTEKPHLEVKGGSQRAGKRLI